MVLQHINKVHYYLRLLRVELWNFDVSLLRRLKEAKHFQNQERRKVVKTYRVARSLSTSLLSISSAVNSSKIVRNSSASGQSLHTLLKVFGPRPSLGALPSPRPKPVLSLTNP